MKEGLLTWLFICECVRACVRRGEYMCWPNSDLVEPEA